MWATDLWIGATENWQRIMRTDMAGRVFPIYAEAHALPFAEGFFDAIVSLDAYQYFGTDDLYLDYFSRFVAAAHCQGAGLHYLDGENGVKDIDVHLFYLQDPEHPRLSRTVYRTSIDLPDFGVRRLDFIRSLIPALLHEQHPRDPIALLRRFLVVRRISNASHLSQKAVIGLLPADLFDVVIWPLHPRELT